jgi:hypothetical protein
MPAAPFSFLSMANEITVKPAGQFTGMSLVCDLTMESILFGFLRLASSSKLIVSRPTNFLNQSHFLACRPRRLSTINQ